MSTLTCSTCARVFEQPKDFLQGTSRFRVCARGSLWFECSCRSCLVLEAGEFPWYKPAAGLSEEGQSLFELISSSTKLPRIPSEVAKLQAALADPELASEDLEEQIKGYPPLVLAVFECANSMVPASRGTFESLSHAITYIGRQTLNELASTAAVRDMVVSDELFDVEKFWNDAAVVGYIAERLVQEKAQHLIPERDYIYLGSSLCNVGKLVMALCFREQLSEVLKLSSQSGSRNLHWRTAEEKVGAYSHAVLGEIAGAIWGFPDFVLNAIRYHCSPPIAGRVFAEPKGFEAIKKKKAAEKAQGGKAPTSALDVIALAVQLSHWALLRPEAMSEELLQQYCEHFQIDAAERDRLGDQLTQEVQARYA